MLLNYSDSLAHQTTNFTGEAFTGYPFMNEKDNHQERQSPQETNQDSKDLEYPGTLSSNLSDFNW